MNASSSEKAMISSIRSTTSRRVSPSRMPLSTMFSRPLSSVWKPAPSSSSGQTRPWVSIVPLEGRSTPAIRPSVVLLPAPFGPITLTHSPRRISNGHVCQRAERPPASHRPNLAGQVQHKVFEAAGYGAVHVIFLRHVPKAYGRVAKQFRRISTRACDTPASPAIPTRTTRPAPRQSTRATPRPGKTGPASTSRCAANGLA